MFQAQTDKEPGCLLNITNLLLHQSFMACKDEPPCKPFHGISWLSSRRRPRSRAFIPLPDRTDVASLEYLLKVAPVKLLVKRNLHACPASVLMSAINPSRISLAH